MSQYNHVKISVDPAELLLKVERYYSTESVFESIIEWMAAGTATEAEMLGGIQRILKFYNDNSSENYDLVIKH